MTMRVLFPYMARWHSANRTRFHHLLEGLARRGHRVVVFQPPPRPDSPETNMREVERADVPGLEVRDVPVPADLWNLKAPLAKLWKKGVATLMTRDVLQSLEPSGDDVLLLYNIPQVALAGAVRATVVVDVADDLLSMLSEETGPWAGRLILPVARRAWDGLLSRADLVTASSSVLAERFGARLVPNGAHFGAPVPPRTNGSAPCVGYVGAFEYFVDFDLLLRTAALVPECSFRLVGGGRARAAVEKESRGLPNVRIEGPVRYDVALERMAGFDVATIPFRPGPVADAAAPLKLFEYLAMGRPVLGTPAEEMRRIASGWIEFAATPAEWAAAIRRLVARPEEAAARAAKNRAEAAVAYDWERIVERFEALLLDAVRGAGRPTRR